MLASELQYVSAPNPRVKFMISIVSAGVQMVLTVKNVKLFSSFFGSCSLYFKMLLLQEN